MPAAFCSPYRSGRRAATRDDRRLRAESPQPDGLGMATRAVAGSETQGRLLDPGAAAENHDVLADHPPAGLAEILPWAVDLDL
jgi:hypothetical protein